MKWYALLPLVALASGLTQQEQQGHTQYYGNHRRPCGESQFSVLVSDTQNYTLRTSGIPPHNAFRTSPYRAAIQDLVYTFPREPVALEHPLCVPKGVPIGFALDGVPFYAPLAKDWNNAVEGSCAKVYDGCGGNVDRNNQYYYSGVPNFNQQCLDLNANQESLHIGVAIDGFPIYYERRFNGSLLDECGGRYLDTTNKRFYRYVVSDTFPYTIGCFRGKVQNISTLTYCKGHEGEYGALCACVNVGPPGMAVGFKWLEKDAVTVGACQRRPVVQERSRPIICNRDEIPEPDYLEEDRRSATCVDFRALYSLIVIQGHKGGLAPWTRLWNYGKEEELEFIEEKSEYVRHFKALRWLLDDLHVLQYPELYKYEQMMKNKTKPLCPSKQRKLRNALAQIWTVSFLREAHSLLREGASDIEKEEVQRAFYRLMYVLKTLKTMGISAYVKYPEKKEPYDLWGVWLKEEEDHDDEEEKKKDDSKLDALVSQLTALQTLGQFKEKKSDEEGGDDMRKKLINLLWEVQGMSEKGEEKEGEHGKGGKAGGEGYSDKEYDCEGEGEGYGGEGYGGEGHREGEGYGGEGYGKGEGHREGEGYGCEGHREGEGYGGEGHREGEGYGGEGYRKGGRRRRGGRYGAEGEGGKGHGDEDEDEGHENGDDSSDDYEMHEEGMEGMRGGMRRRGRYQRKRGYYGMEGEGEGEGKEGVSKEGGRRGYHGKEGEGEGYRRGGRKAGGPSYREEGDHEEEENEDEDEEDHEEGGRAEGSYGRRGGYHGMEGEGRRGRYYGMEGEGSRGRYHGMEGEGSRGGYHGMEGEGSRGRYYGMEGEGSRGGYHGMEGEGSRGGYHGMEGEGSRGGYHGMEGEGSRGGYHGMEGEGYGPPPAKGRDGPPPAKGRDGPPPSRGGGGGDGQCPSGAGQDPPPRDMMRDMMDMMGAGGDQRQFQRNLDQIRQLIAYVRHNGGGGGDGGDGGNGGPQGGGGGAPPRGTPGPPGGGYGRPGERGRGG